MKPISITIHLITVYLGSIVPVLIAGYCLCCDSWLCSETLVVWQINWKVTILQLVVYVPPVVTYTSVQLISRIV